MRPLLLVLTVIQNAEARAFVRMVLEGAGHRVIEAAGSSQARALLSNGLEPDLLLCEGSPINSSRTSPFREFLKFAPAHKICPILRLNEQGLRSEAVELGINRTLIMPVTPRRRSVRLATYRAIVEILLPDRAIPRNGRAIPPTCLPFRT